MTTEQNAVFDIEKLSIPEDKNTLATKIRILKKEGILPKIIDDILYALRIRRNDAPHTIKTKLSEAIE